MAGYNHFDYVPSTINRKRSVFKFNKCQASSAYVGFLYPVCAPIRMMPGSSLSLDLACEIRSGALIAPVMDELICDFFSFFVPNRIVWEHWKQFIGAIDDVLFNNLTTYNIPSFKYGQPNGFVVGAENFMWNQMIACHFGLPYTNNTTFANCPTISALPFRGYTFIWNEFFRPEQIVTPQVINRTDAGHIGMNMTNSYQSFNVGVNTVYIPTPLAYSTATQSGPILGGAILPVYRAHRTLWTSCLPNPSLTTLSLLSTVEGFPSISSIDGNQPPFTPASQLLYDTDGSIYASADGYTIDKWNWQNVMLTVNNYRETIMLQNYYDCLNRAGSRYDEILFNIFGTRAGNSVIDIPELISHKRFTIYRNQVVATAEGTNSPIGSQGAYIDTVIKDNFFTRSTTEHGYIHLLYAIRPSKIRYSQGIEPEWQELDKFSLYYPQFDGMGDVIRRKKELFYNFGATEASQNGTFGYQEYGAVWKYQKDTAVGWLDHHTVNPVLGMTIQEALITQPTLNGDYLSCLNEFASFAQCLAIVDPKLAPQFVLDIRLTGSITHPMPVYNIPGNGALL